MKLSTKNKRLKIVENSILQANFAMSTSTRLCRLCLLTEPNVELSKILNSSRKTSEIIFSLTRIKVFYLFLFVIVEKNISLILGEE